MAQVQEQSLKSSSSAWSIGSLATVSRDDGKSPSSASKRTQMWVVAQRINGAQIVGRDRRIASAHRSALYSMLDEITTMFPIVGTDVGARGLVMYDLEIEIDDDDQ